MTAAFTWPLVIDLGNTLPDWGDGADSAWRIGSIAHQLSTDPFHLYNTQAFYPLKNGLTLDELLTGQGLLAAPVIWLTDNPPLAFNLLVFLAYMLSGFSMWLLVRYLTGNGKAGLVAGLIFAFSPWHYGQYAHLGLVAQQWMIFALYFLIRFIKRTKESGSVGKEKVSTGPGRALEAFARQNALGFLLLFIIFFAFQAITAGYYAYYETILVGFYLTYYFVVETGLLRYLAVKIFTRNKQLKYQPIAWKNIIRQLAWLVGAAFLVAVVVLPFIYPFFQVQAQSGFRRDLSETSYWSASPNSLMRTVDRSWLYKPVQYGIFHLQTSPERMLYPGIIAVLLAFCGFIAALAKKIFTKNNQLAGQRFLPFVFILLSFFALILSFGPQLNLEAYGLRPTGIALPYRWLYETVPGFDALRVPLRFGQLLMLGIAVCAGYGVAWFDGLFRPTQTPISPDSSDINVKSRRFKHIWLSFKNSLPVATILLLVGADFFAPGLPNQLTNTKESAPLVYQWLTGKSGQETVGSDELLLELPVGSSNSSVNTNPIYLMYGLQHKRPMLNGSANIVPPGYARLVYEMESFPTPATLDIIEALGPKFVIVHTAKLPADANRAELEKQAAPGGRLELVVGYPSTDGRFKDALYRVKRNPQRFQPLASRIPAGSSVFLADSNSQRRLYTYTLAALLGPGRHYFAPFSTVYRDMMGGVQTAQPGQKFDCAIFYKSGGPNPADYGFTPADLVPLPPGDFDSLALYRKE